MVDEDCHDYENTTGYNDQNSYTNGYAPAKPQRAMNGHTHDTTTDDDDSYAPSSVKHRISALESEDGSVPSPYDDTEMITASVDARRGVVRSVSEAERLRQIEDKRQAYDDLAAQLDELDSLREVGDDVCSSSVQQTGIIVLL